MSVARDYTDYHHTDRPVAAMDIDYPDGTSIGLHAHPRAQLLFAIQGIMQVRAEAGIWVVPPNRAVWLAADIPHEVRMCGMVKMRTLFVDPEAAAHLPAGNCVIEVSPLLRELLVAAVLVPIDYDPGSRDGRLIALLLDELEASNALPLHLPTPSDWRLRHVCECLSVSPGDTSTVEDWAGRLGIAAKTLHRLFRQETGMSFGQWRQQARLLYALERLARGDRIIDVAAETGYASQSAFTAMFHRQFGMPPSLFYR
jgi:AraC-like DNA-binding protein/mannose-6-phosphate isomerase-like protein (cupin superfamily)